MFPGGRGPSGPEGDVVQVRVEAHAASEASSCRWWEHTRRSATAPFFSDDGLTPPDPQGWLSGQDQAAGHRKDDATCYPRPPLEETWTVRFRLKFLRSGTSGYAAMFPSISDGRPGLEAAPIQTTRPLPGTSNSVRRLVPKPLLCIIFNKHPEDIVWS